MCCKDLVYAIIKDNKLYRLTFSKDLAYHIVKKMDGW